jgi:hypothetical protein
MEWCCPGHMCDHNFRKIALYCIEGWANISIQFLNEKGKLGLFIKEFHGELNGVFGQISIYRANKYFILHPLRQ